MTLTLMLIAAWAVLVLTPDTGVARWLHRWMVATPARRLPLFHRGHLAFAVLLAGVGFGLVWLIEGDAIRLLSMAAPEIATWATMFEVTTLLDGAIAAITAASVLRTAPLVAAVRRLLGRRPPRTRRSRVRAEHRPANDDEDRSRQRRAA